MTPSRGAAPQNFGGAVPQKFGGAFATPPATQNFDKYVYVIECYYITYNNDFNKFYIL